jgi:hypothetical protein
MDTLRIQIGGTGAAMGQRFVAAWRRAETGDQAWAETRLIAEDWATFRTVLPAALASGPAHRSQASLIPTRAVQATRDGA